MSDFLTGNPVAGELVEQRLDCAIDTYYVGMPLAFVGVATAAAGGSDTGDGTCTVLSADKNVVVGEHVLTFSAALVAELVGPDNKRESIALTDGGAKAFNIGGLNFTITDGSTAFVDTDSFTITVTGAGTYGYDADKPEVIAWDNATLAAAATISCAVAGSNVLKSGIVDDSGSALTVTKTMQSVALSNGIALRDV